MEENPVKFGRKSFVNISDSPLRERYDCVRKLGKGGYGKVFEVLIK